MRINPSADAMSWRVVSLAVVLVATGAVISTYTVFSNMYDEPAHIAAGMEWLSRGTFTLEPQHPPLSRVASALGPWLAGERGTGNTHLFSEGRAILGRGEHYQRMLLLARLGHLPFFLVLVFVTWYWARRVADERTAAVAAVFVAANPNVLAHAGVAGTDMGPAALMPAALLLWPLWLQRPTMRLSVALGAVGALCALSKFSAAAYWIAAALLVALVHAVRQPGQVTVLAGARRLFRPFLVAAVTALLITWAMYRFSVGPIGGVTLPAPEFWIGLRDFVRHGTGGHPAYLFGDVRLGGWWYYDLAAVLVKTPIPLLLFGVGGCALVIRERWLRRSDARERLDIAALAGAVAVLVVASLAPVDLGIRLDLAFYPMFSVLAAMAVSRALADARRTWHRAGLTALGIWTAAIPIAAHPDHVAWFNAFAGSRPERVLVDSNLDWGQDLYRLRDAVLEHNMDSLRIHYFGTAELAAVGIERTRRLRPDERATGWVAASETFYAGVWSDTLLHWLRAYDPVGRAGKSIRLYYIAPGR